MAGGYWETQNKVRPGAYVNFKTNDLVATGLDSVGPVVIPIALDWGEVGKFIKVTTNTKFKEVFGKSLGDILPIREAFKGTGQVIAYNLSGIGNKATGESAPSGLTATAVHGGADGNKLSVMVTARLEGGASVKTFYEGVQVESQTVASASELADNAYVTFSGELPASDAIITLKQGTTVEATNESYSGFAAGLDTIEFKTIGLGTDEESIKSLLALKVKEWRETEGKNVALITNDYADADSEGVISVKNGVHLTGNEKLTAKDSVYYYAAAYANAGIQSLTYAPYPGAVDCERLSHDEIVKALKDGHIIYTFNNDRVVVEQDINTHRSFTPEKNQDFRKGKLVRTMDIISDNVQHVFSSFFIGRVTNNETGRNLFKQQVVSVVFDPLAGRGAIDYEIDDIVITQGAEKDAVVVVAGIKLNDAMEKLYMTVNCQ